MSKKKKTKKKFTRYLFFCEFILSIIVLVLGYFMKIIPMKYFLIFIGVLLFINFVLLLLLFSNNKIKRGIGLLFSFGFIALYIIGIKYECSTLSFFSFFGGKSYNTENYLVYVLNNSDYKDIKDLKEKNIKTSKNETEGLNKAKKELSSKINVNINTDSSYSDALEDLNNKKVDAVLIEEAQSNLINEETPNLIQNLKVIYTFSVKVPINDSSVDVNVNKENFNVYISGIDTYGSITNVSRSDVNILLTVNPKQNKILVTSIPRDYYVTLHSKGEKDKLTHAGIYGINESISTIEDLLNIKINYYYKVNFTSLVDIVNLLDGITVDSDYSFTSVDGYSFKKGSNNLDGKKALSFSRERKAFPDGDNQRIKNQQKVLEAIFKKALSKNNITKYNSLIKSLNGKFSTNMSNTKITDFIRKQINDQNNWEFLNYALEGSDGYMYTYSYPKSKLYVMIPSSDSLDEAKSIIQSTYNY